MDTNLLYLVLWALVSVAAVAFVQFQPKRLSSALAVYYRHQSCCNYAVARHERRVTSIVKRAVNLMQSGDVAAAARVLRPNQIKRPGPARSNPYAKAFDLKALFKADQNGVFGKTQAGNTAHYAMRLWR